MRQLRSYTLRALAPLSAPLLALLLLCAASPAAADVSVLGVKNAMVQFLLRQIGTPGAFEVTAGAVTEPEPGVTALNDVRVADRDGVWLTLRRVSFSWNASALLSGRVEMDLLRIEGMRMARLSGDPEIEGGALAEAPPPESVWPRSPIDLHVKAFELRDVYLSDRVLPQAIAFDGDGAIRDEGDAQTLRLKLKRRDAVPGRIDLSYERRFKADRLSLNLDADEGAGGLVATVAGLPKDSASRIAFKADGPPRDWRATLSARSDNVFDASGEAAISYHAPVAATVDLSIRPGPAMSRDVRIALGREAAFALRVQEDAEGVIRVENAAVKAAEVDLGLNGFYRRAGGGFEFALKAQARRGLSGLTEAAEFEKLALDAQLKGAIPLSELTGVEALGGLRDASFSAEALGLRIRNDDVRSPALNAQIDGRWSGERATMTAAAEAPAVAQKFVAALAVPLKAKRGEGLLLARNEAIEGSLDWAGEIADIWPLVPAPDQLLSGAAAVNLQLGGTLDAPKVSGAVALDKGRYENLELGAILEDIAVRSRIDGGSQIELKLSARAGGGRIDGDMALDLAAKGGPGVAATVRLTQADLARREDLRARVSGEISARGPVAAPKIVGGLVVDEAELRLIAPPAAAIPDLGPVRRRGDPAPQDGEKASSAEAAGGPTLDLSVSAPRKTYVRGRGLDSEWRAALKIAGPAAAPQISGRIEKLDGRLDLLGRRFTLARGVIDFAGAKRTDPRLDLVFTRAANDIEGRVIVGGVASAPSISFASTPALPPQEVLPRVLFGRSKQSLSLSEATQLASGVATLTSGEAGLIDRVRRMTGLDVLDYGETGSGGEAVTAGRYVGDGVFVGARQTLDGKGGAAVAEVEVTDGISVDAEVGGDGGSSVGATWKFDF